MIELTKYELLDLAGTYHGLGTSAGMGYFSIVSAYLIVAFLAGDKLNRQQVIVISGLFVVMALNMTWAAGAYLYFGQGFVFQSGQEMPITVIQPHHVITPLLLIGIIAALKFMWDVRHPKTE